MYLVIDCAGHYHSTDRRLAVYGLVVRRNGRVCHRESGPVCSGRSATADVAGLAALARGLDWVRSQPAPQAGFATFETDWSLGDALPPEGTLPRGLRTLARFVRHCIERLSAAGWIIRVRRVDRRRIHEACLLCEGTCRDWSDTPGAPLWLLAFVRALKGKPPEAAEVAATATQENWTVICDGGYRTGGLASGAAVFGLLVRAGSALVHTASGVVGDRSNSFEAECGALEAALRWAESAAIRPGARVEFRSDCQAVFLALKGKGRPARKPAGAALRAEAERVFGLLRERACWVVLQWVPRKLVAEADQLCRQEYRRTPH